MGWLQLFDQEEKTDDTLTSSEKKPYKVLLIDDEGLIVQTLRSFLESEKFIVFTATDGQSGYELFTKERPHIVVTDIRMPGMSGLELLTKIRRHKHDTEIVVITGHGDMDSAVTALRNQAADFLVKPFDLQTFAVSMERAVERYKLRERIGQNTSELERLLGQVNESKQFMETIFQNSPNALITYDNKGTITAWNEDAEKITGYKSSEVTGKTLVDIFKLEAHLIDQGAALQPDQRRKNIIAQIMTREHEIRYISRNVNPLLSAANKVVGAVESFQDITEQLKNDRLLEKRYLQVQTINEIGKKVASSHELDMLIRYVSEHLVKTFFESSQITIFFYDPDKDKLVLRAMAGYNIERVRQKYPEGSSFKTDQGIIGRVFNSGEAMIVEDVTGCPDYFPGTSDSIFSEFAFPIRSKETIFGILNIENTEKMQLDESDRFMLEALAEYLGISTERIELLEKITQQNQLLEKQASELKQALRKVESQKEIIEQQNLKLIKDLQKAGDFQKSLLPETLPEPGQIKFAAAYVPSSQLGGDIYDVFAIDEQWMGILVADASGHGVAAAMLAAMFKMTLQKYASEVFDPDKVMQKMNQDFCQVLQMGEFFTAFYAMINVKDHRLIYSNAAHPRPLLYNYESDNVEALDSEGFLLGVMDTGISYEKKEKNLQGRYRLLIYTDGVNEAINSSDEQFGDERVINALKKDAGETGQHFLDNLRHSLTQYTGSDIFEDDVTLVVMDLEGQDGSV